MRLSAPAEAATSPHVPDTPAAARDSSPGISAVRTEGMDTEQEQTTSTPSRKRRRVRQSDARTRVAQSGLGLDSAEAGKHTKLFNQTGFKICFGTISIFYIHMYDAPLPLLNLFDFLVCFGTMSIFCLQMSSEACQQLERFDVVKTALRQKFTSTQSANNAVLRYFELKAIKKAATPSLKRLKLCFTKVANEMQDKESAMLTRKLDRNDELLEFSIASESDSQPEAIPMRFQKLK